MDSHSGKFMWAGGLALSILALGALTLPFLLRATYTNSIASASPEPVVREEERTVHINTPEPMKALYMTACVAATPSWRESLKQLIEETELNAVVIDIKDSTGTVSFSDPSFDKGGTGCVVKDLREFIAQLHQSEIYVIGRISVFQDPSYTKTHPELAVKSKSTGGTWKDRKGLSFVDVGAKPYWEYIVSMAETSYELGFDEINFDYIRYPSDGNMSDTYFSWTVGTSTKPEMLESFFKYLSEELNGTGMVTSADLFGMTTTVTNDMNIGQVLERALPYFDYIYPMVYPSHYPPNWNGFSNPAAHPYEVITIAMSEGIKREQVLNLSMGIATSTPSKIRPWLQDFDLGAEYGVQEVQDQIRATYESGITSWLVWNAANKYTEKAFLTE